ncbi:MAG: spore coat associated protein CotJA [Clostridiales bacterium]|nr:spore coat associated protein CotJA [Clostridiales bacterium]
MNEYKDMFNPYFLTNARSSRLECDNELPKPEPCATPEPYARQESYAKQEPYAKQEGCGAKDACGCANPGGGHGFCAGGYHKLSKLPENATVTMAYVPMQEDLEPYEPDMALKQGTLFPPLDKPFYGRAAKK